MTISEAFNATTWAPKLARRKNTFEAMINHVWNKAGGGDPVFIVETGSAWDMGNWDGQGQSTLIWDWLIEEGKAHGKNIRAYSVDINEESVTTARFQVKNVDVVLSDSVKFLNGLTPWVLNNAALVYLDSYDWSQERNIESAFHHMAELAAVWRDLRPGCMVAVDDRHGDYKGKHWLVEAFMGHYLKTAPAFKSHQIGWIKA